MTDYHIALPELHPGQVAAFNAPGRFKAIRAGRRWGKTEFGCTLAVDTSIKSYPVGWFAPEYKFLTEPYQHMLAMIGNFVKSSSESKGVINLKSGGNIDFWTLENPLAGRSRKYKLAIIDEAAFTKNGTMLAKETGTKGIWEKNIRPTLVDLTGSAIVLSNTNGEDGENFLWQICNQPQYQFVEYHAPSSDNPYLPQSELDELKSISHPLVWKQEYLAEFVDWSGVAFFPQDKLLYDGQPMDFPSGCDYVFAIIDSATKTGKENDGTAVVYGAFTRNPWTGPPLVILDWDIAQIAGNFLIDWIPNVFARLEELAIMCKARMGSAGAHIEDKASGIILLQQCENKDYPAHAIDSKLTSLGKTERALNVSGYVDQNKVKMTRHAFEKVSTYKGVTRNHFLSQVTGFRVGAKDQIDDDLLDGMTYLTALSLGNAGGF